MTGPVAVMRTDMCSVVSDQFQVLDPVVRLDAVAMMHDLSRCERPPDAGFHHEAVLSDVPVSVGAWVARHQHERVAVLDDGRLTDADSPTRKRTEQALTPLSDLHEGAAARRAIFQSLRLPVRCADSLRAMLGRAVVLSARRPLAWPSVQGRPAHSARRIGCHVVAVPSLGKSLGRLLAKVRQLVVGDNRVIAGAAAKDAARFRQAAWWECHSAAASATRQFHKLIIADVPHVGITATL